MQPIRELEANIVFSKTARGQEEVLTRSHGLAARHRQVLILINGARSLGTIAEIIPASELAEIVGFLLEARFIEPAQGAESSSRAAVITATSVSASGDTVAKVKEFMVASAQSCLGLLAVDVIRQIEIAQDKPALMTAVAQWHMALRESREGKRLAGPYLDQVRIALAAGGMES